MTASPTLVPDTDLARLLTPSVDCPSDAPARDRRRRRRFLAFTGGAVVVLAAWIADLGATLPQSETVTQWRLVWVGFDVFLLLAFAVCGWAAWKGRRLLIPATLVTGTLLFCDAWFDIVLSWNTDERWWSVASAAAIEIPLAAWLWRLSARLAHRVLVAYRAS